MVSRKMNTREHPIPRPAFAPAEREDLVAGTGEDEVVAWALLGVGVLWEFVVVVVRVPVLAAELGEGVGVAFEEVVPALMLLVVSTFEVELELGRGSKERWLCWCS